MGESSNEQEITLELVYEGILETRRDLKCFIDASEARTLLTLEELRQKLKKLEEENSELREKLEVLEKDTKKKNIVVFGLGNSREETSTGSLCQHLNKALGTSLEAGDISNYYFLGKSKNNPIKIEFVSQVTKTLLFKKVKKLKGTKISISNDLTKEQQRERKILIQYLKKERQIPENKSYIRGNKLYINDIPYTVNDLLNSQQVRTEKANSAPSTPVTIKISRTDNETKELCEVKQQQGKEKPQPTSGHLAGRTDKKTTKEVSDEITKTPNKQHLVEQRVQGRTIRTRFGSNK